MANQGSLPTAEAHSGPPLLRRSALLPDESLPSLVLRLARLNHYLPPTLLDHFCLAGVPSHARRASIGAWPPVEVFAPLVSLTTIPVADLYAATAHRFAPILSPLVSAHAAVTVDSDAWDGAVPLLTGAVAVPHVRPLIAAQFCPHCLADRAYHRVTWMPYAVAVCHHHACLLVTDCPACGRPISVAAVTLAACQCCGTDLRTAAARDLRANQRVLQSQRVIRSWLGLTPTPDTAGMEGFPDPSPALCYQVLDVLRRLVMLSSPAWWYRHRPVGGLQEVANGRTLQQSTPGQIAGVYATGMQGLQSWPDGFYAFLRAYRWAAAREQDPSCAEEVYDDGIVLLWLTDQWQHPAFAHMREALHMYLRCECRLWEWGDGGRARILECFHELCARATSLLPLGARGG